VPNSTSSVKAKGKRQKAKPNCFLLFTFYFLIYTLLFSAGCGQQQKAVNLYVDAVMLAEIDENEKAIEKLNSAAELNKRFSLAYSLLGEIYQEINDYEKSADSYEKATELNPWSFRDYFNLGRVYQVMKKFTQAVKAYARACELEPEHLDAHINTAKCYYEIKDYNSALIYGERAEQIDPNVSEVQKALGDIYKSQENYDRAVRSYERVLEMSGNGNIYQYLGYCYLRVGDSDKAIESYSRAIEVNDNDWEAHRALGVAYMVRGIDKDNKDEVLKTELRKKAIRQWQISLDIKPDQSNRERLLRYIRMYSK